MTGDLGILIMISDLTGRIYALRGKNKQDITDALSRLGIVAQKRDCSVCEARRAATGRSGK